MPKLYPNERAFRRQLVKLYVDQKRMDDAEKEIRAISAANSADIEAGLDVVRFVHSFKGIAAARNELMARINKGGEAFPYQMALAEYYFAEGNFADSEQLLEKLAGDAKFLEQTLMAQDQTGGNAPEPAQGRGCRSLGDETFSRRMRVMLAGSSYVPPCKWSVARSMRPSPICVRL